MQIKSAKCELTLKLFIVEPMKSLGRISTKNLFRGLQAWAPEPHVAGFPLCLDSVSFLALIYFPNHNKIKDASYLCLLIAFADLAPIFCSLCRSKICQIFSTTGKL